MSVLGTVTAGNAGRAWCGSQEGQLMAPLVGVQSLAVVVNQGCMLNVTRHRKHGGQGLMLLTSNSS